ncbi:MAG TPA: T9SS type A sorting domain-containing protein [Candidatus Cloacimonetes bacterium]|nr:T9SS type A sorting domain-containing protein [Candidatus Cloacimonadota bacterium]
MKQFLFFVFTSISIMLFSQGLNSRYEVIENFDDGEIDLYSFPGEDNDPDDWALDQINTFNNSPFSLRIFGNTWKVEDIEPTVIDSGNVWQIAMFVQEVSEIQAFGIMDTANVLLYSLFGTQELDIEEWIPVYQGAFEEETWNLIQLPVADDWFAWYDYYPTIESLVFVNDQDDGDPGIVYFDEILNITEDLPVPPQVEISYDIGDIYRKQNGQRNVDVQFYSEVIDPDSEDHLFLWDFGDDSTSVEQNPIHTYLVEDDHPYTVLLEVVDTTNCWGQAVCQIEVDEGETTFPITMNFVGDIMLARGYESGGGIIPTQGVEAIFEPTLDILGNAADITIANLECPLTTHWEHHPTKTIYFKGSPENVDGLVYAGIDIITLANNHVYDYMLPGMQETQQVLADNNILYSGAGADSYEAYLPLFYNKSGVNIAFLASSDRTGQYNNYQPYLNAGFNKPGFAYMTPYYVQKQIQEVQDVADLIVVEVHCGSEYSTQPGSNYDKSIPLYQYEEPFPEDEEYTFRLDIPHMWDVEYRHFMIDAGADAVICHHPHIIQGLEIYNGKLIAHSLGNFAFDLSYAETMPTMILNTKINETGFYEYSVTPVFIDDYIPQRAEGGLGLHILDYVARRSKEMNTYLHVDREEITASVIFDTLNMEINTEDYAEILSLSENNGEWFSEPFKLQRDGHISLINSITPGNSWQYRLGREIVWFGNCEDEGCTLWNLNSDDEWYDDTESYEGERSICHRRFPDSGDNIVTNFTNRIKRYSDGDFTLHGYFKTQNGSNVTIEARYYQTRGDNPWLDTEDIGVLIDGDTSWNFYWKKLEVPDNCNFFDIRLNSDMPADGEALSWFDNVGIIEWSDWETFDEYAEIENPHDYYFLQIKSGTQLGHAVLSYTETNYGEGPVVQNDEEHEIPTRGRLIANYPNPFHPSTTISFQLNTENTENTEINIYNIKGQKVKQIVSNQRSAGQHSVIWDGQDSNNKAVSSGIYFYNLRIDGKSIDTKKCLLLR